MKIIIYAVINVEAEKREGLLNRLQSYLPAVHAQEGCIRYDWAADSATTTQVNVYEEWESEAALEAHFAGKNFAAIGKALGEIGTLGASAKKFRVDSEAGVFNADGVPTTVF